MREDKHEKIDGLDLFIEKNMVEMIRTAWGWSGLIPKDIAEINPFGNLILNDINGAYWRICPEELRCMKIAHDGNGFSKLWERKDFRLDWEMEKLVMIAAKKMGVLQEGRCFCFKLAPVLGGSYEESNISSVSILELIAFSGRLARQIKDIPDGGQVKIELLP